MHMEAKTQDDVIARWVYDSRNRASYAPHNMRMEHIAGQSRLAGQRRIGVTFHFPDDVEQLTAADLWALTNNVIDAVQKMLRRCSDVDITFVPVDPLANDLAAADDGDANIAWTLGHIIVHTTASSEESAFLAAEQARGVEYHGRSRSEVPWQTVTTVALCRARLEESRRMRLASLSLWPADQQIATSYQPSEKFKPMGPVARFASGLRHESNHLAQVRDVIQQAREARFRQSALGRMRLRLQRRPVSPSSATPDKVPETTDATAR
jgi:hypothetical protein